MKKNLPKILSLLVAVSIIVFGISAAKSSSYSKEADTSYEYYHSLNLAYLYLKGNYNVIYGYADDNYVNFSPSSVFVAACLKYSIYPNQFSYENYQIYETAAETQYLDYKKAKSKCRINTAVIWISGIGSLAFAASIFVIMKRRKESNTPAL